ncbi:MAG: adenylyl-sulfate kinase, partial [Desulfuromonadales bacterium]|nr:adenylyl-sulfate kinase [Desulfuromonadales bacterium]NIS42575.1 adenylyl-sulfate kinase [Desulfuromonadales bacterium]
ATVGAGMIDAPLVGTKTDCDQPEAIDRQARAEMKGQQERIFWFYGNTALDTRDFTLELEKELYRNGLHTHRLDYQELRAGLNSDIR